MDEAHMKRAVALSLKGIELGHGGPFGAVVVRDGAVVGEGWNEVLHTKYATAHAEVGAIRDACRHLASCDRAAGLPAPAGLTWPGPARAAHDVTRARPMGSR